jgi:hypothetical protein
VRKLRRCLNPIALETFIARFYRKENLVNLVTNSRPRKSLANQLDRLDGILDGMAEALNEAVAAAVTTAVKELLSNPQVLRRVQEVNNAAASSQPKQSNMRRFGKAMGMLWSGAGGAARNACNQAKAAARAGYIRARAMVKNVREFVGARARAVVKCSRLVIPAILLLGCTAKRWISKHLRAVLVAAGTVAGVAVYRLFFRPFATIRSGCHSRKRIARTLEEWLRRIARIVAPQSLVTEPANS